MAATGSLPHVRLALAFLAAVAAFVLACASAEPAAAQRPGAWDAPAAGDPWGDDDAWEDPSDTVQGGAATELPEGVAPDVELPATPWVPPTPSSPSPGAGPSAPTLPVPRGTTIRGRRAVLRADGRAAIPRGAPKRVRVAIAAANRIIGKPYKWGGGHGSLRDSGYDCSGTVGYALVHAGLMGGVMVSGQMARWGRGGAGRYITVYANNGHVYAEIAGLRLDTSPVGDPTGRRGVRWRPVIGRRGGFAARHPAGL